MARIRTIKPEFPQSETVGALSRDARLLFVQLWTIADDSGRARASSRLLASLLYPYDDDAPALIDGWLIELADVGCIQRYEADGTHYLCITKWAEHQKIDRPTESKLPGPPEIIEGSRAVASPREPSMLDLGPRTMEMEEEGDQTTEGTAPAVAAPATPTEPDAPAPPKREPLGPGAKLFKALTHASPNIEQRSLLDAAYERHGPEKFEAVIREWLRLGYRKQNADGMVNVMERGWTKRQPANGRGVLANGHGASPEEAAAIDQVIADGMADVMARLEAPASAPADAERLWHDVHAGLALRMPSATLKAWVDPVQAAGFDGETLTLLAPSAAVHSWLTQRLARELDEALADVAPGVDWVVVMPEAAAVGAAA